jgi:hypothetical protein
MAATQVIHTAAGTAIAVNGVVIDPTGVTTVGQALTWNGSSFVPGVVASSTKTLQDAYTNGSAGAQIVTEDATRLGIVIRQDVGATADPVFAVQTNSGGTDLLNVNGSRVRIGKPILMDATGGNTITMSQSGIYSGNGPPTFTTVSAGEKLSLVSRIDGANTNLAIGVDATGGNGMWFGVSQAVAGDNFKWYGGTTEVMRLTGTSLLQLSAGGSLDTRAAGTLIIAPTNATTLQLGGAANSTLFRTTGTDRWQITSGGTFAPFADNTYSFGSNTVRPSAYYALVIRSGDTAAVDTTGSALTITTQAGGNSSAGAAGSSGAQSLTTGAGGNASAVGAAGLSGISTVTTGAGGAGLAGTNGTTGGNGIASGASGALTLSTGNLSAAGAGGTGTSGTAGNGAAGVASGAITVNVGVAANGGAGGATSAGGAGGAGGTGGNAGGMGLGTGGSVRAGVGGVGGNTASGGNAGTGGAGGTGGQISIGTGLASNGAAGGNGGTVSAAGTNGNGGNGGVGTAVVIGTNLTGGAGGQAGGVGATGGTGGQGGPITNTAGTGGAGGAANGGTQGNGGNGGSYSSSAGSGGSGLTGGNGANWTANSGAGGAGGNTNSGDIILNVAAAGGAGTQGQFRWQNAGATIITLVPSTSTFTSATAGAANVGNSTNYFGTIYSRHFHGAGTAPTIAVGNAAQLGTGPAAAVTAGSDAGATVTLTTGTGPTAFVAATEVKLGTVSFNTAYSTAAPRAIVVTPAAALSGALATGANGISCYAKQSTTTTGQFDIFMVSSGTPTLAASTAYPFACIVIQ